MFERIRQMIIKEFSQVFRDKRMVLLIVAAPILQLVMFGYVVTTDVTNVRTALYDLDKSQSSREFARRLVASGYFELVRAPESPNELRDLLDSGEVSCAVQINRGFDKEIKKGLPAPVQIIADGT